MEMSVEISQIALYLLFIAAVNLCVCSVAKSWNLFCKESTYSLFDHIVLYCRYFCTSPKSQFLGLGLPLNNRILT